MNAAGRAVMRRARALFCRHYNYPATPFRSIGMACFRHCVEVARDQLAEEARRAAIPAEQIEARKEKLKHDLFLLDNADSFSYDTRLRKLEVKAELALLDTVKSRGGRLIAKGKNETFPRLSATHSKTETVARLSSLAMQAERQVFQHGRRA